jgi:hypothetical protein
MSPQCSKVKATVREAIWAGSPLRTIITRWSQEFYYRSIQAHWVLHFKGICSKRVQDTQRCNKVHLIQIMSSTLS